MLKHKKKLVYNKLTHILSSYKLIFIGKYDNNHAKLWKDLKKSNSFSFYAPKNSLCRIIINEITSRQLESNNHNPEKNLFNGSIFFLYTNELRDKTIFQALNKIKSEGILIYGGLLDNKIITFSDVLKLISLLKYDSIYQKSYQDLNLPLIHFSQFFSNINHRFFHQFNNYKNLLNSRNNKKVCD